MSQGNILVWIHFEEFELNKLLPETDVRRDEVIFPHDIVNIGFKETDKIWTPPFSDMVSSVKGKVAPYFVDNLFQTMKN